MHDTAPTSLAERDRLALEARALLAGPPGSGPLPAALGLRLRLACEGLATKRLKLEHSLAAVAAARRELRCARRTLDQEVGRARHALGLQARPTSAVSPGMAREDVADRGRKR